MVIAALSRYGVGLFTGRHGFRETLWRTPTAMRLMRREVLEAIDELEPEHPFITLQVQSMFDGHVEGVPHFVYTDHTHLANLGYPTFKRRQLFSQAWIDCEREVYANADACFIRSPHVAASLIHDYGVDPADVVYAYAGPSFTADPARPADPGRSTEIVFVGMDWERKGGPALSEAFARVRRAHPEATLTVVGCEPPEQPGMQATGRLPFAAVSQRLSQGGIFCMPTRIEPFGVALIEAMAHGLPIVSTRVGAVPDIVEDGGNAILVEPDDVEALTAALDAFLSDPERRRAAGVRSLAIAADRYTWDAVIGRLSPRLHAALGEQVTA